LPRREPADIRLFVSEMGHTAARNPNRMPYPTAGGSTTADRCSSIHGSPSFSLILARQNPAGGQPLGIPRQNPERSSGRSAIC
jgi:hypothetical protein